MRKVFKRFFMIFFAVLFLVSLVPVDSYAVDPVSAATMANALAQAITAYGASNGVSMMFDVTNTDGIGETIHEMWGQFKTAVNDNNVPSYDSLAVTIWSTVFKKIGNNVGINLSSTTVSYLDAFWNWLLSGPAEMTKVDNQYYEWTVDQQTGNVLPINVYSDVATSFNGIDVYSLPRTFAGAITVTQSAVSGAPYSLCVRNDSTSVQIFSVSDSAFTDSFEMANGTHIGGGNASLSSGGWYYVQFGLRANESQVVADVTYNGSPVLIDNVLGARTSSSIESQVKDVAVRPYVGNANPQNVYIPDTEDVNYQPLPYEGGLDIPWSSEWGDGQTVTDAIGTSISGALDTNITQNGTLTLEGDDVVNPPAGDVIGGPDSYQVPGLADVFPFCIPFDIYNFLSALAAEPQAPYFECDLDFPEAIGGTQTIEIDFDTQTWNTAAQILRTLELLAFIVGLAFVTRSMFIRG